MPFGGVSHTDPTILPTRYFGDYALYFSGRAVRFNVIIKNSGARTFKNLRVVASQEYFNVEGLAGEPIGMPGSEWFIPNLGGGEEISLAGMFAIPRGAASGLDQTHLQIFHWAGDGGEILHTGGGRLIVDDPQAGIWCPPRDAYSLSL